MRKFRDRYLKGREDESLRIVDLGSQNINGSYKELFDEPAWRYIGIDMVPGENVELVLENPYQWKGVRSNSVDVLISGQAFEHIEYFWITILEVWRILKVGGLACIIAPSGGFEHRFPVDCWRFYPDGFSALSRFAQLDVLNVYTQWGNLGYQDDSDEWHDTILVGQKPRLGLWRSLKNRFRRYVIYHALTVGL